MEYFNRDVSEEWLDDEEVPAQDDAGEVAINKLKGGRGSGKQQSARQRIETYLETRRLERMLADDFDF